MKVRYYQVAYVSGSISNYGSWTMDTEQYKKKADAEKASKKIAREKALNGRVSVRVF